MKLNELMIGDWVLDKKTNRPYKIIGTNDLLFHNDYSPIPLTVEILEKNGFRKGNYIEVVGGLDTYYLGEEIGSFRIHRLQNGYYQFGLAKIKYVHQLQHALRLCNINKEIEIMTHKKNNGNEI